jgi:hypothetical protein
MEEAYEELLKLKNNQPNEELEGLKRLYADIQMIIQPLSASSDSDEENQENQIVSGGTLCELSQGRKEPKLMT